MTFAADYIESRRISAARWLGAALLIVPVHIGCMVLAVMHWDEQALLTEIPP
jgi:hypothetical protein